MNQDDITIMITVWKRPYLDSQLNHLISQTIKPKAIWIIHNENHIEIKSVVDKYLAVYPQILVIDSDSNLKYFGRFMLCNHVSTNYVLIIDDDVMPSSSWLEICLNKSVEYNAVVSCSGRIIRPNNYRPEEVVEKGLNKADIGKKYFIGDSFNDMEYNFSPEDKYVDYGCNSYFFRTEWIRHFWNIYPFTFESAEDIHLSASLKILAGIPTIVPEQLNRETTGNLKKKYSADQFSSWLRKDFINIRQSVFEFLINEKKWQPLLWKKIVLETSNV